MLILTLRTDKPEAEIGLFSEDKKISYIRWQAHRALAETIHTKIKELLDEKQKNLQNLEGIVVFQGPGSFTGLRIGITVANTFADSLKIPIRASKGENWLYEGLEKIKKGQRETIALPEYGSPPHITKPKH